MPLCERAVVYVTDPGFLIPTLVSAEQVRGQVEGLADVVVAFTGFSPDAMSEIHGVAEALGLRAVDLGPVELPEGVRTTSLHIPSTSVGRLLLPERLDPGYRAILYLDGDTQVVGDIRPLVRLDVPPGLVAAAPDCAWIRVRRIKFPEGYPQAIGIEDAATYFNAGVMAFERATFDSVMPKAFAYYLAHSEQCRFMDQSALNAVMKGRWYRLSPRYNFLSDYVTMSVDADFPPVILHFNGPWKPWVTDGPPWNGRYLAPYAAMVERFPVLKPYAVPVTRVERTGGGGSVVRDIYNSAAGRPVRRLIRAIRRRQGRADALPAFDLA